MARIMAEWHPKHGPIAKIRPSDGVKGNTAPLELGLWYDSHEVECHLGNVGLGELRNVEGTKEHWEGWQGLWLSAKGIRWLVGRAY